MDWTKIIMTLLMVAVLPLIPKLFSFLKNLANRSEWLAKQTVDDMALDYMRAIVEGVTMPIAEKYKELNADGNLSDFEKKELKQTALDELKKVGKAKGIDFLKKCGPEVLSLIVDRVVEWVKNSKK